MAKENHGLIHETMNSEPMTILLGKPGLGLFAKSLLLEANIPGLQEESEESIGGQAARIQG